MKKFDLYSLIGAFADVLSNRSATKKETDVKVNAESFTQEDGRKPTEAPSLAEKPVRPSFADRKTVVEMIRNHDALSRKIAENAAKGAQSGSADENTP